MTMADIAHLLAFRKEKYPTAEMDIRSYDKFVAGLITSSLQLDQLCQATNSIISKLNMYREGGNLQKHWDYELGL